MGKIFGFIALLIFVLLTREIGRILVLWKLGIPSTFSYGKVSLSEESQAKLAALPTDQLILFYGSGIIANLICGIVCFAAVRFRDEGMLDPLGLFCLFILTPGIIKFPERFALWVIPGIGMLMIGVYSWRLWHDPLQGIRGPLTLAVQAKVALESGAMSYPYLIAGTFLVLGSFTSIPAIPLEGRHIVRTLISVKYQHLLSVYGIASLALGLVIYSCGAMSDIYTALKLYSGT